MKISWHYVGDGEARSRKGAIEIAYSSSQDGKINTATFSGPDAKKHAEAFVAQLEAANATIEPSVEDLLS